MIRLVLGAAIMGAVVRFFSTDPQSLGSSDMTMFWVSLVLIGFVGGAIMWGETRNKSYTAVAALSTSAAFAVWYFFMYAMTT